MPSFHPVLSLATRALSLPLAPAPSSGSHLVVYTPKTIRVSTCLTLTMPPPQQHRWQHITPVSQGLHDPSWTVTTTHPRPHCVPPTLHPVACLPPCRVPPPPPLHATAAIKRHGRTFTDCEPTEQSVKMQQYSRPQIKNDAELSMSVTNKAGNWGNKFQRDARWVRRGKLVVWTSSRDDWEVRTSLLPQYYYHVTCIQIEERARKCIKSMLPSLACPPLLPGFAHLQSPSPPLLSPYPPPLTQHMSFTSFVLDPATQHSSHSGMLTDLERAMWRLIEGEASL